MSDEITVKVNSYGPGRPLGLVYIDPTSGRKKAKSSGTTDWREAERQAGELEKELRAGRFAPQSKVTWQDFRRRYVEEKGPTLARETLLNFATAANHLERVLNPDRLSKLSAAALSRFTVKLRAEGMKETTLGVVLRHVRAALGWGVAVGLLPAVPKMQIPPPGSARCRAVTGEEFDRMLAVVPQVRPKDFAAWVRYLRGLYLGGLRLEEGVILSWDDDSPFAVDLTGRRPAFRIDAAAQKARRDERLPMTEDFYNLLGETPPEDRHGRVFPLKVEAKRAGKVVAKIGKKAGVVVSTVERRPRDRQTGKPTVATGKKFATCHDLRRSFGTRWAKRVMPAVLQRLMRHADIATTMRYYVTMDADTVADELWGKNWGTGNTSGNNGQKNEPAPTEVNDGNPCNETL
jgi:integrase